MCSGVILVLTGSTGPKSRGGGGSLPSPRVGGGSSTLLGVVPPEISVLLDGHTDLDSTTGVMLNRENLPPPPSFAAAGALAGLFGAEVVEGGKMLLVFGTGEEVTTLVCSTEDCWSTPEGLVAPALSVLWGEFTAPAWGENSRVSSFLGSPCKYNQ